MRPMLAATLKSQFTTLRFPLYASVKLDGIRALVLSGVVKSRTMKPIPNVAVQKLFGDLEGLDGELIVGDPAAPDCYRKTVSCCMSRTGDATGLKFYAFDKIDAEGQFRFRIASVPELYRHKHLLIEDAKLLEDFEATVVAAGHEGLITRDPDGWYKTGRSTMTEQGMVKVKRFLDDEAEVVAIEEMMHNGNQQTTNVQGYAERTSHKANMQPLGVLGALVVKWRDKQFRIGTGFTARERADFWEMDDIIGRLAKFKYLPIGMKDVPRHPVFLGWREE